MMKNKFGKMILTATKIAFVCGLLILVNFNEASAQKKKQKTVAVQKFVGSPETQQAAFKSFIIRNIGRRVYLKISFAEVPSGYKSDIVDPVFYVDNYSYWFKCGETMDAEWTTRCRRLNYDGATQTFTGYFKISEPTPKIMRTNRLFDLTPSK